MGIQIMDVLICSGMDDLEEGSPILPCTRTMCTYGVAPSHGVLPGSFRLLQHLLLETLGNTHQGNACLNH